GIFHFKGDFVGFFSDMGAACLPGENPSGRPGLGLTHLEGSQLWVYQIGFIYTARRGQDQIVSIGVGSVNGVSCQGTCFDTEIGWYIQNWAVIGSVLNLPLHIPNTFPDFIAVSPFFDDEGYIVIPSHRRGVPNQATGDGINVNLGWRGAIFFGSNGRNGMGISVIERDCRFSVGGGT